MEPALDPEGSVDERVELEKGTLAIEGGQEGWKDGQVRERHIEFKEDETGRVVEGRF